MKSFIAMLVIVCFAVAPMTALAAQGGKKGPNAKAYEKADDNAKFKRDGQGDEAGDKDMDMDKDQDREKDKDNGKKKQKQKQKKKQKGKGKNKAD
jgi:hypothetical protein